MTAAGFDVFSIGHSNIPLDRFIELLQGVDVNAVADVRSVPVSRHFPWFTAKNLAARLIEEGMIYEAYGDRLGGRPRDPALYRDGMADYEAMAQQPEYRAGIERLVAGAARHSICLMCAEREPLDCHRCLLVSRSLAERGLTIGHILHDGTIEPHQATERRLLALNGVDGDLFVTGQDERLAAAYRHRTHSVAFRLKSR
jgi:uncharacterized protein (DUF488 family)